MVSRTEHARRLAEAVPDPEIPVLTVGDLGLVREVREEADGIVLRVATTYSGCPAGEIIRREIETALAAGGLADAKVEPQLSPAWTTEWMSGAGRRKLLEYGIAPPVPGPAPCPRCGSKATEEISRFGSTPCKALWRCTACLEPFERFKCH